MSIEMAKIINTSSVILISSVKTFHELPGWMKLSGKLLLDKIFPLKSFHAIEPLENYNLGIENMEELRLVREYRKNISKEYTNWATHEILNWKNEWVPPGVVHIHGNKDHIFPIKKIKADYVIAGGGHFMIMNKAGMINEIIEKFV
jgi:hypothetical protein